MSSSKSGHRHKKKKERRQKATVASKDYIPDQAPAEKRLEIVLKCDTSGCTEAVIGAVASLNLPQVNISIISSGVGAINKSDVFMAATGSNLILGFNVGIMPHIDQLLAEHNVEIRIYEVIYKLLEDLESIADSLIRRQSSENIIGTARVIALFKSSRKGIILGCEVLRGKLVLGHFFRVVGAMGPLYTGKIESLHIEKDAVREAVQGQQVGLKIKDFNKARIGDLVETFRTSAAHKVKPWQPQGKIFYPQ